jgi:hypothetical protein
VIEVPSSVRLDPPPHPSWPNRRRTDALVKKPDRAPSLGDLLAMSEDELAAFLEAFDEPSVEEWEENFEEAYWRSARNSFEYVRLLRLIHPTARQLVMTADEAVDFYRRITCAPRTEAQRQAHFKILSRVQPGPKSRSNGNEQDDKYLALWQKCIAATGPNFDRVYKSFVRKATRPAEEGGLGVEIKTARNQLYRLKRSAKKIRLPGN